MSSSSDHQNDGHTHVRLHHTTIEAYANRKSYLDLFTCETESLSSKAWLWSAVFNILYCYRSVKTMRTCALYGSSQGGAFCTFETRKDAQSQFGITYKNLVKLIDRPGEAVNGWVLTSSKPADYIEPTVTEPGVYVVDSAVSNVGLDLINCLRDEEGKIVTKMRKDGYLHATSMCDSFGKLWANFSRLDRTTLFVQALSTRTGIPINTTHVSIHL
jgi:KilA-N domain